MLQATTTNPNNRSFTQQKPPFAHIERRRLLFSHSLLSILLFLFIHFRFGSGFGNIRIPASSASAITSMTTSVIFLVIFSAIASVMVIIVRLRAIYIFMTILIEMLFYRTTVVASNNVHLMHNFHNLRMKDVINDGNRRIIYTNCRANWSARHIRQLLSSCSTIIYEDGSCFACVNAIACHLFRSMICPLSVINFLRIQIMIR